MESGQQHGQVRSVLGHRVWSESARLPEGQIRPTWVKHSLLLNQARNAALPPRPSAKRDRALRAPPSWPFRPPYTFQHRNLANPLRPRRRNCFFANASPRRARSGPYLSSQVYSLVNVAASRLLLRSLLPVPPLAMLFLLLGVGCHEGFTLAACASAVAVPQVSPSAVTIWAKIENTWALISPLSSSVSLLRLIWPF